MLEVRLKLFEVGRGDPLKDRVSVLGLSHVTLLRCGAHAGLALQAMRESSRFVRRRTFTLRCGTPSIFPLWFRSPSQNLSGVSALGERGDLMGFKGPWRLSCALSDRFWPWLLY